jgi:Fe-S-cluster-containing dehydrogenase component
VVECSYYYHPANEGLTSLLEYATFAVVCHRCEEAPCVNACYKDALERQEDDIIKRYNFRCVSCKSCAISCPFGVITQEMVPFLSSHCDYCLGRLDEEIPVCTKTCPHGAMSYKEIEESHKDNIYFVGKYLAVKWPARWVKQEEIRAKR